MAKVEYLLVGGFAVAFHGHPRPTGDLDVWIDATPENALRVLTALHRFGFADPQFAVDELTKPDLVFRMGVPPLRIEILTSVSGLQFSACRPHRVATSMDGVPVDIIGLEDLKANKLAAGRRKDLDDLDHLP